MHRYKFNKSYFSFQNCNGSQWSGYRCQGPTILGMIVYFFEQKSKRKMEAVWKPQTLTVENQDLHIISINIFK